MASLTNIEKHNTWRVRIRRKGFPHVSINFKRKKDAISYIENIEDRIEAMKLEKLIRAES